MAKFIESSKIKVFPAGFRKGALDTSKLTTEENLTSLTILSSDKTIGNRWITNPLNDKEDVIYIRGYKFVFPKKDIPENCTWAAIQLRELGVGNNKTNVLKPVESTDAKATDLDDNGGNFLGLGFYENEPSGDDIYKVKKDSSLVLNSLEIKDGASNENIAKQFTTKKIIVNDGTSSSSYNINIDENGVNSLALNGVGGGISIIASAESGTFLTVADGVTVNITSDETTLGNITLTKDTEGNVKIDNYFNLPKNRESNKLLASNGETNSWISYSENNVADTIVKRSGNDIKTDTLNDIKIWLDKLETQEEPILKLTHEFTNTIGKSAKSGLGIEWPATLTVTKDGSIQTDTDNDSVTGNVISIGAGTLIKQDKNKRFVQIGNTENTGEKVITLPLEGTPGGVLYDNGNNTAVWKATTTNGHPLESANTNADKIVMTDETGYIKGVARTNHATSEDTYGLATSGVYGVYGHVKLQKGTLGSLDGEGHYRDENYVDGVAASIAHNHDGKYAPAWIDPLTEPINLGNNTAGNLNYGATINIPKFSVDKRGIVNSGQDMSLKLPDAYNKVGIKESLDTNLYLTGVKILADGSIMPGDTTLNYNTAVIVSASGNLYAHQLYLTSDKRLKENERPYKSDKSILDLPIYKYDYINGSKNQIGCMAQDLKEICPEIVEEDEKGYLHIQESKIVYLLIEEVKKLKEEIKNLKNN